MENYLLKSSLCLIALYLLYKVLLKKETHHQLKRFIGLVCIAFACFFLFIPLGSLLVPDTYPELINVVFMQGSEGLHEGISRVITEDVTSVYLTVYLLGVLIFAFQSLYGLGTLVKWYIVSERTQKWGFTVVKVNQKIAPFTFFKILFIGNESLSEEAMKTLIVHEQYHRDQWHSIDTTLLEILAIVFWFNPVIWLFRKDIKTVHEYMADAQVLKKGFDIVNYQYLLFQTKTGMSLKLGSHFSHKTNLKKRITMMNQEKTKTKKSYARALVFLPVMGAILLLSAFTEANHNLSKEIKLLQQRSTQDTIPTKKELENEKFQFQIRNNAKTKTGLEPIYILREGITEKEITFKYMKKINTYNIASVNVLKGKSAEKKYGKKGKNGVVIIELKKKKNE